MRDYRKDLDVCEKATPGEWEHERDIQGNDKEWLIFEAIYVNGERILRLNCDNAENIARFISLARTALPWYIRRVMELEEIITDRTKDVIHYDAENKSLRAQLAELESQLHQAEEREAKLKDVLVMVGLEADAYEYPVKDRLEWISKEIDEALAAYDHAGEGAGE